jgi:nitrate/nitrite-specific signal transduction histidine kinase
MGEVTVDNRELAQRLTDVSDESEHLSNLYVASHRLHSSLEPAQVTEILCEILVDLVGAQQFGLMLLDEGKDELNLVRSEGAGCPQHVAVGQGPIGQAVRDLRAAYNEEGVPDLPAAIVPLQIRGHGVGALVIDRLLHGRTRLPSLSKELLGLLARHAATAIVCSQLYSSRYHGADEGAPGARA